MNPTARSLMLFGAIGLLVFGIVCLKQKFNPEPMPPAFLPGDASQAPGNGRANVETPTILSAEPGTEQYITEPNLRQEVHPLPFEDESSSSENVPVYAPLPTLTPAPSQAPQARWPVEPSLGNPGNSDAIELLPPLSAPSTSPSVAAAEYVASNEPARAAYAGASNEPQPIAVADPALESLNAPSTAFGAQELDVQNESDNESLDFSRNDLQTVTTTEADSLWRISEKAYGRGDFYKALFLLNQHVIPHPDRLGAGVLITVPPISELQRRFPEACPREALSAAIKS